MDGDDASGLSLWVYYKLVWKRAKSLEKWEWLNRVGGAIVPIVMGAGAMPVDRCVKVYPISEHEMTTIGTLTSTASFCVGFASLVIGGALSVLIDVMLHDTALKASNATWCLFWVLVGIAVIFYVGAGVYTYRRATEWKRIKSEATEEVIGLRKAPAVS